MRFIWIFLLLSMCGVLVSSSVGTTGAQTQRKVESELDAREVLLTLKVIHATDDAWCGFKTGRDTKDGRQGWGSAHYLCQPNPDKDAVFHNPYNGEIITWAIVMRESGLLVVPLNQYQPVNQYPTNQDATPPFSALSLPTTTPSPTQSILPTVTPTATETPQDNPGTPEPGDVGKNFI